MVDVLRTEIRAQATGTETIDRVKAEVTKLHTEMARLGSEERHGTALLGRFAESFALISERSETFRESAFGLREAIGRNGETIGELIPTLGALGAAASITGLVDMAREAAEARTQLNAMALMLGTTVQTLQTYRLGAQEADVPIEAMQTGILRLDRAVAAAASGKSKDVAEIFERMGISLRDTSGHLKSADQLLPLIGESLRRTSDSTLRNAVAMQLFGRSGAELIPFLTLGKNKIDELQKASARLNASYSSEDNENVENFKNSWIELDTAVGGLKDTITADLAPALTPIIHGMTDWISANKTWLGQKIKDDFIAVGTALENVPWKAIGHDAGEIGRALSVPVEHTIGWEGLAIVLAGFGAIGLLKKVGAPAVELYKVGNAARKLANTLGRDLVASWSHVGAAAAEAGAKEEVAATLGGAKLTAAERAVKAEGTVLVERRLALAAAATVVPVIGDVVSAGLVASVVLPLVAAKLRDHRDDVVPELVDAPKNPFTYAMGRPHDQFERLMRPGPSFEGVDWDEFYGGSPRGGGYGSSGPFPAPPSGELKVSVTLNNAPPGSSITTEQTGNLRIDQTDVGRNMPMGHP